MFQKQNNIPLRVFAVVLSCALLCVLGYQVFNPYFTAGSKHSDVQQTAMTRTAERAARSEQEASSAGFNVLAAVESPAINAQRVHDANQASSQKFIQESPNLSALVAGWQESERLDRLPQQQVDGHQLYGRFENNEYKFLLISEREKIGVGTTVWLDTDQDVTTGFQGKGQARGMEFNLNIYPDGQAFLFTGAEGQHRVAGPLDTKIEAHKDGSVLMLAIPVDLLGAAGDGIQLALDINDKLQIPQAQQGQLTEHIVFPKQRVQTATAGAKTGAYEKQEKRVGIVFSDLARQHFWDETAYSQLFMSVQAQVRMAGVPYDFLTDRDLLDLEKLTAYSALIFPYAPFVDKANLATVEHNLQLVSQRHKVGLIMSGGFLTSGKDGKPLPGSPYARMKQLLGLSYKGWAGPEMIKLEIVDTKHPITHSYTANESVMNIHNGHVEYFAAAGASRVLVEQTVGDKGRFNAVVAIESGGRNVHFATPKFMVDANLLWSAVRWSVFGEQLPVGLKISRNKAVFAARNDMDQSKFPGKVRAVNTPLLNVLKRWKQRFNFVGSYYINVGDKPEQGEYTNWVLSEPLYRDYIKLGNEIGTHSYTHPMDTNQLDAAQTEYEFARSREIIEQHLGLSALGAAVPGATEALPASLEIIQHVHYLTGGYSGVGAGFPNAFGYLLPNQNRVYLAPNMSFDFTLIEYKRMKAAVAEAVWLKEFDSLTNHANQAILHWPWHDYAAIDIYNTGYSNQMFTSLLEKADNYGVEFLTSKDLAQRIVSFHDAKLAVGQRDEQSLQVDVSATDTAGFALQLPSDKVIASVKNWYAYEGNQLFLAGSGGKFDIKLGQKSESVTRISKLPARSRLISVGGDGTNLTFSLYGEGEVEITPKCPEGRFHAATKNVRQETKNGKLYLHLDKVNTYSDINVAVTCD